MPCTIHSCSIRILTLHLDNQNLFKPASLILISGSWARPINNSKVRPFMLRARPQIHSIVEFINRPYESSGPIRSPKQNLYEATKNW